MKHPKFKKILVSIVITSISLSIGLVMPPIIEERSTKTTMMSEVSVTPQINQEKKTLPKIAPNLASSTGCVQVILSFKETIPDDLPFNILYRYQTKPLVYVEGDARQIEYYAQQSEEIKTAICDETISIKNGAIQADKAKNKPKIEDIPLSSKTMGVSRSLMNTEYPYIDEQHNVSAKWLADFMGAPPSWKEDQNVYGEEVTIALLSTGVKWDHEVFDHMTADQHEDKSFIDAFFAYDAPDPTTVDVSDYFIGTYMAALLVGGPESGQEGLHNDLFYGFLPNAKLLNAKIDNGDAFSFAAELAALDWASQKGADVCVVATSTYWGLYTWPRVDTKEYWCQLEEEMLGDAVLCYWGYVFDYTDLLDFGPVGGPMGQHPAQIMAAGCSADINARDNKDGDLIFFGTGYKAPLPQSYQMKPDFTVPFYGTNGSYFLVLPDLASGLDKYHEDFFFEGTGAIAAAAVGLVLSAARQDIVNVTPAAAHAALLETAIKLDNFPIPLDDGSYPPLPEFCQGRGIVNISAAYEYLVENTVHIASTGETHANVISGLPGSLPVEPLDVGNYTRWERALYEIPDLYRGETYFQTITAISGLPDYMHIPVDITITGNGSRFVELLNDGEWMGETDKINRVVGKGDLFPVKLHCERNEPGVAGNTYYAYIQFNQIVGDDNTVFTVPIRLRIDEPLMVVALDEFHSWIDYDFRYGMLRLYVAALRDAGIAVTSLPFRWETADLINVDALIMSDNWSTNYIAFQKNNNEWNEGYGLGSFTEIEDTLFEFEIWDREDTTEWWTDQHLYDIWNYWDQGGRIFHLGPNGYDDIIRALANGTQWTAMWDRVLTYFEHFGVEMTKDLLRDPLGDTIYVSTAGNSHPIFQIGGKGVDHYGGTWKILNSSTATSILNSTQPGASGETSIFVEAANDKTGCMIATSSNWIGDNWGITEIYHPDWTNNTGAAVNTMLYLGGVIGNLGSTNKDIVFVDVTGIDYWTVPVGSSHTFEINIFNHGGDPIPARIQSITAIITDPSGASESLTIDNALSAQGLYTFTYIPADFGKYLISITTTLTDGTVLHSYPKFMGGKPDIQLEIPSINQAIEGQTLNVNFSAQASRLSIRPWWRWLSFVEPLTGTDSQSPFTDIKANITYHTDGFTSELVFNYLSGNVHICSFQPTRSGNATLIIEATHPLSGKISASTIFNIDEAPPIPEKSSEDVINDLLPVIGVVTLIATLGVTLVLFRRWKR